MYMHLQREHALFLAPMLILAAASSALLIWHASMMNGMGLTMGMGIGLFLAVWVVMMVAMMAVLTVLIFAEKVFPQAERIAWIAGLALILYGTLVIVVPAALLLNGAGM